MIQIKSPIAIILIAIFFTIITCTTDNSITGNADLSLAKPTGTTDISSAASGDDDCVSTDIGEWILITYGMYGPGGLIVALMNRLLDKGYYDGLPSGGWDWNNNISKPSYDFRDNYLSKSEKGREYTKFYYELSKYGIKNNLINKYPKEHLELLITSTAIAHNLQYGNKNDKILIDLEISDKFKDMLKVYGHSTNHRKIDTILDYLEEDLDKYYNKPKCEIAMDF